MLSRVLSSGSPAMHTDKKATWLSLFLQVEIYKLLFHVLCHNRLIASQWKLNEKSSKFIAFQNFSSQDLPFEIFFCAMTASPKKVEGSTDVYLTLALSQNELITMVLKR